MWYKDRDFPEVKASNWDIVAVINNPKQLQRVIDEHNRLEETIIALDSSAKYWREDSAAAWDKCEERRIENEELKRKLSGALEALTWANTYATEINSSTGGVNLRDITGQAINDIKGDNK